MDCDSKALRTNLVHNITPSGSGSPLATPSRNGSAVSALGGVAEAEFDPTTAAPAATAAPVNT
jgi:hypothetical protein